MNFIGLHSFIFLLFCNAHILVSMESALSLPADTLASIIARGEEFENRIKNKQTYHYCTLLGTAETCYFNPVNKSFITLYEYTLYLRYKAHLAIEKSSG